jgi:hypothetical protein
MRVNWGLFALLGLAYYVYKQKQAATNAAPAIGPAQVASLPVGSAAVVLTRQIANAGV